MKKCDLILMFLILKITLNNVNNLIKKNYISIQNMS